MSQKHVSITGEEYDRYGRLLGTVWSGQTDINAVQLQKGMAWAYRFKGQVSNSEYGKIENEAKKVVPDCGFPRHKQNPGYGVGIIRKMINN